MVRRKPVNILPYTFAHFLSGDFLVGRGFCLRVSRGAVFNSGVATDCGLAGRVAMGGRLQLFDGCWWQSGRPRW